MARKRRNAPEQHKAALGDQIEDPESYGVRNRPWKAKRARQREEDEDRAEAEAAGTISGPLSQRILREARAQRDEVETEAAAAAGAIGRGRASAAAAGRAAFAAPAADSDSDDDNALLGPEAGLDSDWEAELEEVTAEDEAALAAFMPAAGGGVKQRTLADSIVDKIRARQAGVGAAAPSTPGSGAAGGGGGGGGAGEELEPKVVEVYRAVGRLLQRYTSGRVPKALKIVPGMTRWEEVLLLTEPDLWSPHATYQATRIFVSNLNARMAQRFLNLVLLPAVRADIAANRRLHFALFQALKKAAYKPGAFYKGLLLPLAESGTCTLREAVILSSVLQRTAIPVGHSAAALLRLAEAEYNGITSFFIRVLLDKKYALPYRVVDALVDHFCRFRAETRQLPVVWHQSLLVFVQRYKGEIRAEDKDALRALLKAQHHYKVSPEVYRELDGSRSRGERDAGGGGAHAASAMRVGGHCAEDPRHMAPVVVLEDY